MNYQDKIAEIDRLQALIHSNGKYSADIKKKINYKFRLDWNYYSNSMEGNTLTKEETRSVMVGNVTVNGKPIKDVVEMSGHDYVINEILSLGKGETNLSEKRIKEIHKAIVHEEDPAQQQKIGQWKTTPNFLTNYKDDKFYFADPADVPKLMHDLLDKTKASIDRIKSGKGKDHPVILALKFQLGFVTIHPFYDGNGRISRILGNLILISFGYPPIIIKEEEKKSYYKYLADIQAYGGKEDLFYDFMMDLLIRSQQLVLDAIEGKDISDDDDIDKRIFLLQKSTEKYPKTIVKSDVIVRKVITEIYTPYLKMLDQELTRFEKLFSDSGWYRVESDPGSFIPVTLTGQMEINRIIEDLTLNKHEFSYSNRVVKYFERFNDEDKSFDIGVSINIGFDNEHYEISNFIGDPHQNHVVLKSFAKISSMLSKEPVEFIEQSIASKKYNETVTETDTKKWAKETAQLLITAIEKEVKAMNDRKSIDLK